LYLITDMFCAQFWLGIFQLCHYIDYISSIYDNPVIFLHYYQLSEQLMQQRNTVALTPSAYTISQSARLYRGDDTAADLLNDQSVNTNFCTTVKYKIYCVAGNCFTIN